MRFAAYRQNDLEGIAAWGRGAWFGLPQFEFASNLRLEQLVGDGAALSAAHRRLLAEGRRLDESQIRFLPPIQAPRAIICVGLNYADHSAESGFLAPTFPVIFLRTNSSLIGHRAPILRPKVSEQLDYEGELVAVISRRGRAISKASALDHVAGYSIFNDASIRDYQFKSNQWTLGKNFDSSGAFGPSFVTADELPHGASGLRLETRLNGKVVQRATTNDMIFDIATLISIVSEVMTLSPGDIVVTGTPSGVGLARKPPLWMKHGDLCEVEIEGLGILSNPILDE
jgi:2-keto-4-pentenoate hydratase/2-oxohepta-3-ene-1,7-dioic acid hydratase in catechol pathway